VIYREWNLVPYAGTSTVTSHTFLKLLCDMYDLSGSHGDCINDIISWSIDGDVDVVRSIKEGLKIEEEDKLVEQSDKIAFVDWMEELGLTLPKLIEVEKNLGLNLKKTGNAWLHYREIEVNGEKRVELDSIDSLNVMYIKPEEEDGNVRSVVISPDFFLGKWESQEPIVVRVWPSFTENGGGDGVVRETIFHIKNRRDYSDFYGRPDSLHKLFWMFTEFRQSVLMEKVSNSEVASKALLAMQAQDPAGKITGDDDGSVNIIELAEALRKVTTNKGTFEEVESLGVIKYPFGSDAPSLLKLDLNRDYRYTETSVKVVSDHIYAGHRWSKLMTGFDRARGSLSGEVMRSEFLTKNTGVIAPYQMMRAGFWKRVFKEMSEFSGNGEVLIYGIRFTDKIVDLSEKLSRDEGNEDNVEESGSDPVE